MLTEDFDRLLKSAMGLDVDDYDRRVIALTNTISRQVFPVVLDVESDRWWTLLERLHQNTQRIGACEKAGGLMNRLRATALRADCALIFRRRRRQDEEQARARENFVEADGLDEADVIGRPV